MAETGRLWPKLDRIPHPPNRVPLLGDLVGATPKTPMQGAMTWARRLGPIYTTKAPGFEMVVVSGADLVAELADEERFTKHVGFGIDAFRPVTGDGLFTAFNDEPNWRLAHDILTPAFSREAMERYHGAMLTTVHRLLGHWDARCGGEPVDVVGDATKLALETIGRAGFGYDFGSFSRSDLHPLVAAMMETLQFSMKMPLMKLFGGKENDKKIKYMHDVVDEVVRRRRASGDTSANDLLGAMLNSTDADGESLAAENIRFQILTFLIAGYGTSAGMLSFALHFLASRPDVLKQAVEEVDQVLGSGTEPSYEQVVKLRYLRRVLDETLRLWPPTPAFLREAREDTVLGGVHPMKKGAWAVVLIPMLHRDPVWGGDVESFDPDRFLPEANRARPPHAYKPFGTGARACIGRQFAQHEATLALALILSRYRLQGLPGYELRIREAGFFMPDGFRLALERRP
ncbi:cytochrome P450 [Actinocorallia sp. B10E7]|uniref:cytochrome P450 n=1 Tax=Actinocorallia sp. B10E7 TaxID=3153558 RepID=UPI00325E28DF